MKSSRRLDQDLVHAALSHPRLRGRVHAYPHRRRRQGGAAERLACLEGATREIAATRVRRQTAEEDSAADAAGPELAGEDASEEDLFGAENLEAVKKAKTDKRRAKRLTQKVVEFRVNSRKEITAVLENGQVWRQLSSDSKTLPLGNSNRLFTVTIKKGAMGNYMMKINEPKQTIRVRRIK